MKIVNTVYAAHGEAVEEHENIETYEEIGQVEAHSTEEEGLLGSLGIDGSLFIFQLVNFAIVAVVLWFMILKPLTKKMTERQEKIEKGLKDAEKFKKNLEESEKKYDEKINEARKEASKVMEEADKKAEKSRQETLNKANHEADEMIAKAKSEIEATKEDSLKQIRTEAANMVAMGVEKVLNKEMDDKEQERLTKEAASEIDNLNK